MSVTTLARKGTPGFHNPDIVRRSDGQFNVWLLRPTNVPLPKGQKHPQPDPGYTPGSFNSAMRWVLIAVKPTFKAALQVAKLHR